MTGPMLSPWERDRLAVLRVTAMATDPAAGKVEIPRADLLTLLAAVDRLAEAPPVSTTTVHFHGSVRTAFLAGNMFIYGGASAAPGGEL